MFLLSLSVGGFVLCFKFRRSNVNENRNTHVNENIYQFDNRGLRGDNEVQSNVENESNENVNRGDENDGQQNEYENIGLNESASSDLSQPWGSDFEMEETVV